MKTKERPKQKPPTGFKPTEKERDAKIDEMVDFIANHPGYSRHKIYSIFTKKWDVCWQTVENYLNRAREQVQERIKRPREELRANAITFYEQVIADSTADYKVRLKAQALLVELMGLNAPAKVEMSGPDGGPIETRSEVSGEVKGYLDSMSVDQLKDTLNKLETVIESKP